MKFSNKKGVFVMGVVSFFVLILIFYIEQPYKFIQLTKSDSVIIRPTFTESAYSDKGFYDYYKKNCDESCLTTEIKELSRYETSKNGLDVLKTFNFNIIDDITVHENPEILSKYKTVVLLHNEYVTQEEFDAITSHPHVIYLYPNALYAKITYEDNKITLIRGHNYPESSIRNGFDWKFDNTPLEYDSICTDWKFYRIDNGYMLNCYPDTIIKKKTEILLAMVKLFK